MSFTHFFFNVCSLILKVTTIGCNAIFSPSSNIPNHPKQHLCVQGHHLPPNIPLKLIQGGGLRAVDLRLQIAPKESITGVKVRRPGWPVTAPDWPSANNPVMELSVQIYHVHICDMTGYSLQIRLSRLPPFHNLNSGSTWCWSRAW